MKKGIIAVIIIIAVLLIGGIVAGIVILNSGNSSGTGGFISGGGANGQGLSFEENQEDEVKIIKGVTMPGWQTLHLEANTPKQTVDFYNPEENTGSFHLTFELKLSDGESLYKSGLVKAGDHVRNITLSRALEPGTYDAVIHIQPYTADEYLTAKNNANVSVKLIVG